MMTLKKDAPKSILFACTMNSIRSPMAEALAKEILGDTVKIDSAGVFAGPLDPFVDAILEEVGLRLGEREAKDFSAVDLAAYDAIVALTPQAGIEARKHLQEAPVELWNVPNPTDTAGSREVMLEAYREARDVLKHRILARFSVGDEAEADQTKP